MHRSPTFAPRVVTTRCLAGLVLLTAMTTASCGDGAERGSAIEPVGRLAREDGAPRPVDPPSTSAPTSPSAGAPTTAPTGAPGGSPIDGRPPRGEQPAGPSDAETLVLVQSVLDRYDAALTTVAADPLAAVPGHPSLDAWNAAVVESGSFSVAMLGDMADRATSESTVVRPGAEGHSYRHHVLRAVADDTGVSFTWCGHSPGLGIDTTTGEVVDDAVALSSGTGELRHDGAGWRLLTLDAFDLEVAPSDTADPCPARVRDTTEASR